HGRGRVRLAEVEAGLKSRREFLVQGHELATKAGLKEEQRLVAIVNAGIGRCPPLARVWRKDAALSAPQQEALPSLLNAPEQVVARRGAAGTGKTVVTRALVNAVREQHELILLAPTKGAVKALHEVGLAEAETVQSYMVRPALTSQHRVFVV